jgi:predicted metal-dependent hydrolase
MGIDEIEKFLKEKSDWISSQSARMKLIENESQLINATATRLDIKTSRAKLIKRIYELAAIHGFHYNGISIRTQKTLWGSCTAKNHINLNLRLAWLPQELMDYVILHELTHTRIKNHSRTFWNDLEKLTGNTKPLKEKLKITVICIAPRL